MRRAPSAWIVLALATLAPSRHAGAQEVGAWVVRATSDNPELPSPSGFGAQAEWDAGPVRVTLSWVRYADDTDKPGVVCTVYSPRIGCHVEGVSTSARMSGLRFTLLPALPLGDALEVRAGGGISFSQVRASSLGVSGYRGDMHLPNSGQIGYLAAASLALAPLRSVPARVVAGLAGHWVDFHGCVDPTDVTSGYAPFCGWSRFTELHLGLTLRIPRG